MEKLPRIWILNEGRVGDTHQMRALAAALDVNVEELPIAPAAGHAPKWPALAGASTSYLTQASRALLHPPWPDVVFAAGRGSAPAARWIKDASGGRTRIVLFGRPRMPLRHFDLVITSPAYLLPERDNVLVLHAPLHTVSREAMEKAARQWLDRLSQLPRPWIAVLVGGKSPPYRFVPEEAARFAREVTTLAARQGGAVLATTIKRTGAESARAFAEALEEPFFLHGWEEAGDNPYLAFLALADAIVVTVDSLSMMAEAACAGKPLLIRRLDRHTPLGDRVVGALHRRACGESSGFGSASLRALFEYGVLAPRADREAFASALVKDGHAAWFEPGHDLSGLKPATLDGVVREDMERAAARVRALL